MLSHTFYPTRTRLTTHRAADNWPILRVLHDFSWMIGLGTSGLERSAGIGALDADAPCRVARREEVTDLGGDGPLAGVPQPQAAVLVAAKGQQGAAHSQHQSVVPARADGCHPARAACFLCHLGLRDLGLRA